MQEREPFETWLNEADPGSDLSLDDDFDYFDGHVHLQWQAWQAASAGRQELVEALRGLLNTWNAVCDVKGWDRDHTVAAELARAALAKHGEQQ
jgi:hypothetical protein